MNEDGVSPVIATVLLISITVLLVSMVYVIATQMMATIPAMVTVHLEIDYREGENKFLIHHTLGDNLRGAFRKSDGGIALNNLIVRLDGRLPKKIRLNGEENFTTDAFSVGDCLEVEFDRDVQFGSWIIVAWIPARRDLHRVKVE